MAMMTNDNVILLIKAQWERGLFIPVIMLLETELGCACRMAALDGFCFAKPYSMPKAYDSVCYNLTRKGWLRLGELTDTKIEFIE